MTRYLTARLRHGAVLARALIAAAVATPPQICAGEGLHYQLHGFAAQAYALSEGANYVGDSHDGSFEFYELGASGALGYGPLMASAQLLLRRFGELDDGDARVDYAFLDYRALSGVNANAGLRLGRVKNYYGLFNDSRDVIFTRPGILLPGSVYFEGAGVRTLLFSSDGGQLYGGWSLGEHYASFAVTRALDKTADSDERRALFGGAEFPGELQINGLTVARLMDEWAAGTWTAALTYTRSEIALEPGPGIPLSGSLDAQLYVASLRHIGSAYAVTAEYQLTRTLAQTNVSGRQRNDSDGVYVQVDYDFRPRWTAMARYDLTFSDRDDRSGRDYARETGGDRHGRYARDLTVGVKWLPDDHWGVWSEYHFIQGSATVPAIENQNRTVEASSGLFLLMLGYHF